MALKLFKRNIKITCWRETVPEDPTVFDVSRSNIQTEITDLRVQFRVRKDLAKTPNTCDVTITNLNDTTRADLETKPLLVQLQAGYDDVYRFMFLGDLRFCMTKIDGPQWHTLLQLGDGDCHYKWARMNRSYGANTKVKQVLRDAARSMGLVLPKEVELDDALDETIGGAELAYGKTRDQLTRFLAPYGYSWSIQNGQLRILRDDRTHSDTFKVISEEMGMIGSPEFGSPPKSGQPPHVTVDMLLYPELMPGDRVQVISRFMNGFFKVIAVEHSGDTHGPTWQTQVELKPLDWKPSKSKRKRKPKPIETPLTPNQ
jgi:hypothetical protein